MQSLEIAGVEMNRLFSYEEYRREHRGAVEFLRLQEYYGRAITVKMTSKGTLPFIPRGTYGMVLWQECDYCGSKAWPKPGLFDYWACVTSGGLVE